MITKALYDYLTSTEPITGYPSAVFRTAQTVGDLSIPDRGTARRYLRDRVGKEIYAMRRPRQGSQHTALTMWLIATNRDDEITGGTTIADAIVQCDVWTRGTDAVMRGGVTATLLRLCCEGFGGGASWGDMSIADCLAVREAQRAQSPADGDHWHFRYSLDLQIFYHQPSAVVA